MAYWQWMGLAVAAAILSMTVRTYQPQLSALVALAAGVILFLSALDGMSAIQSTFSLLAALAGLEEGYLGVLLKVLGISFLSDMASQICQDLGEKGLAGRV